QIRNKVAVHHVDLETVGPSRSRLLHLLAKSTEVSCKNGGHDKDTAGVRAWSMPRRLRVWVSHVTRGPFSSRALFNFRAAATSTNHRSTPSSSLTCEAGSSASPASALRSAVALSGPDTRNATARAA